MAGVAGKSGRKPGAKKTGGRVKGTPNKMSGELKEMILTALSEKGGVAYLVRQADENPQSFMGLLGKVLPMTVQGNPDQPLTVTVVTGVPRADSED